MNVLKYAIGIDVSSEHFAVAIMDAFYTVIALHDGFVNTPDGFMQESEVNINAPVTGNVSLEGDTSVVGTGKQVDNLPPYQVLDYIICIDGDIPVE